MDLNDPQIQAVITVTAAAAVAQYVRENPSQQGPPGPPGSTGPTGNDGLNAGANGGQPRWNPGDLGFFDPNYDGKSVSTGSPIEHTGKETYFRDVHLFVERANDLAATKGAALVRENLWMSLRGTALEWWTAELSATEKRITRLGDGVEEWSTLLAGRFKEPATVAIDAVLRERYTMRDAISRREPREYCQKILRSAKDAGMNVVKNQLDIIWNGIDLELRRDLKKPEETTTVNAFLTSIDDCKHTWWAYASRHGRNLGSGNTSGNSFQASRQSRPYDSRPVGQASISKLPKQATSTRSAIKRKSGASQTSDYRPSKQVRFSTPRTAAASASPLPAGFQ